MRFNDALSGSFFLILGIVIVAHAQTFPLSPGQDIGPGLFPTLLGIGLVLCGLRFLWAGLRQRDTAWLEPEEWIRRPRMALNFAVVVGDLIFYALAVDRAGFFLTAFVFLTVLFLAFEVRRRWIPLLAAGVTLALHFAFYTLLHVPLPWGWLENYAW
jgi:putative tricarboxylic transport membrane protein